MLVVLEILGMACVAAAGLLFNLLLGLVVTGLLLLILAARLDGASWADLVGLATKRLVIIRQRLPKRRVKASKEPKDKHLIALALAKSVLERDG